MIFGGEDVTRLRRDPTWMRFERDLRLLRIRALCADFTDTMKRMAVAASKATASFQRLDALRLPSMFRPR